MGKGWNQNWDYHGATTDVDMVSDVRARSWLRNDYVVIDLLNRLRRLLYNSRSESSLILNMSGSCCCIMLAPHLYVLALTLNLRLYIPASAMTFASRKKSRSAISEQPQQHKMHSTLRSIRPLSKSFGLTNPAARIQLGNATPLPSWTRSFHASASMRVVDLAYKLYDNNGKATGDPIVIIHGLFGSKRNNQSVSKYGFSPCSPEPC